MRWPDDIFVCPHGCKANRGLIKTRQIFECRKCHTQISATTGTMFHRSRVPLRTWFWAIFLMATSKKSISMLYLQRQLGIKSYRTAWLMGHKIRHAMMNRDKRYPLRGTVEADEIFIGGKRSRADRKTYGTNKTPFLIGVEEGTKGQPRFVTFEELENIYDQQILGAIERRVEKGSTIKSDGAGAYEKAAKKGYAHERSVYSNDPQKTAEHLKWVNMLTSNLKRFLLSTHHGVFPKYRKAYLAEFAYRFNRRYWPNQSFGRLLYACIHTNPITLTVLSA
ncbi:MAG: hypothetical protein A3D65_02815 [Candidatus Lloydbacteria bacterium RIFCSPHIGHO2_02_FULL_50_13]|uniref:ISXO2-like transposase domain-containing protein n=1 Tax=Candidatus Lloydbacteria bacterium RIFCSPHIGHO2_02_FULL_50_13 TaxID=1798661 RepID=A0A1G2D667_9BACT|nr:MAG: hypothetical protein A3D65_02815 [Candidatus Lloydbacteria bacterium RIFCSPHIGHO2_02_FULL_50_13]